MANGCKVTKYLLYEKQVLLQNFTLIFVLFICHGMQYQNFS